LWGKQTIALVTTLGIVVLMIAGVGIYTAGQALGGNLADLFGLGPAFLEEWEWLRVPAVNLALFLALFGAYRVLPNAPVAWSGSLLGAAFATLGWIVVTTGFSFYVSHFGSYDRTFGSLGAAVVLMFWLYTVSLILLLGGEISAQISRPGRPLSTVVSPSGESPTGR
jgi:membrane protein